ncbi:MAG: hypothetical protein Kow0098_03720 [Ignavibacteriaceae bacterium]
MKKLLLITAVIFILPALVYPQQRGWWWKKCYDDGAPAGYMFFYTADGKKFKTSDKDLFFVLDENYFSSLPAQFQLNLTSLGLGYVSKNILAGTYRPSTQTYDSASIVRITATPDNGYSFWLWKGSLVSIESADTIIIDSNKIVTARFRKQIPNYRVIINDNSGFETHANNIKSAFVQGYESMGGIWDESIQIQYDKSIDYSFQSADSNGAEIIIRSYTGMTSYITTALNYYPVGLFFPAGSNNHEKVYDSQGKLPALVVTGAGDAANETGYDIEFYSSDPITAEPDLSSYSNGYIAGQLLFIADSLNVPFFVARQLAIEAGDSLTADNGYGQVKIIDAVNVYDGMKDYYNSDKYLGE